MLKKTSRFLLLSLSVSLAHAADIDNSTNSILESTEEVGWFGYAKKWAGSIIQEVTTPAAQDAINEIEQKTAGIIDKAKQEILPDIKEGAEDLLEQGALYMAAGVDHAEAAIDRTLEKAGSALEENLNKSATHNALELNKNMKEVVTHIAHNFFVAGVCLVSASFGLKFVYDGVNEHEGNLKSKPTLKICGGTLMTLASIYTAYRFFN